MIQCWSQSLGIDSVGRPSDVIVISISGRSVITRIHRAIDCESSRVVSRARKTIRNVLHVCAYSAAEPLGTVPSGVRPKR